MGWCVTYQFDTAGQTRRLNIGGGRFLYMLPDRSQLRVLTNAAWCEACRRFCPAEFVPVLERLRAELRDAEFYFDRPGLIPPDRHFSSYGLSDLRKRVGWLAIRQSPSRCLECGSTALIQFPHDWSPRDACEIDIPSRGRCVATYRVLLGDFTSEQPPHFYTAEGDRRPSGLADA
jgi:ferredoxin